MLIDPNRVHELVMDCLFKEEEIINGEPIVQPLTVKGITLMLGLHPGRVESNRAEIEELISNLPDQFKEGWSFLNLCMDKDGNQWTGMHKTCDELVVLGLAIGKLEFTLPREMWSILPGGMPYLIVKDSTQVVTELESVHGDK